MRLWLQLFAAILILAGDARAAELAGRIVDPLGEGLDQVRIVIFDIDSGEATSGLPYRTGEDGRFGPILDDEPGRYRLVATHMRNRSNLRFMTQVVDVEAPDDDARIVMKPVRRYRVEGQVLDPPDRAMLELEPIEVQPDGGPDDWPRNVFLLEAGAFSLSGLPLGRYRLSVSPFGAGAAPPTPLGELEVKGDRKGVVLGPR